MKGKISSAGSAFMEKGSGCVPKPCGKLKEECTPERAFVSSVDIYSFFKKKIKRVPVLLIKYDEY